jgi:hypothetical protein
MQSYYLPVVFVTTLFGDVAVFSAWVVVLCALLLLVLLYNKTSSSKAQKTTQTENTATSPTKVVTKITGG